MIVSQLAGGLGNQLFQYALGRSLSLKVGQPLMLDVAPLRADLQRVFMLDRLSIHAEIADGQVMRRYRRRPRFDRRIKQFFFPAPLRPIREKGHGFDPALLALPGNVYLSGYFQSERYFTDYAPVIRADFALREPMSAGRQAIAAAVRSAAAVSVHVRRGDYLTDGLLSPLPPAWYDAALRRMTERVANPTFFVFSDDPAWSRSNLPKVGPTIFVEPQADGRDEQDMHLMSLCRHHIIANSTFSWWGAWLNPSPDKHVIAPRQWFSTSRLDGSDIVPESWERL